MSNALYYGDNLQVLRDSIATDSVVVMNLLKATMRLFLIAAILVINQSAVAAENHLDIPTEWLVCKTSDDCEKVHTTCTGPPIAAVNKKYSGDILMKICEAYGPRCLTTGPLANGCHSSDPDDTSALCENNRCVLHSD